MKSEPGKPSVPRDVALIDAMVERARGQARLEAEQAADICAFLDLRRGEQVDGVVVERAKVVPGEFAADEVAAALGWTTHRVQTVAARYRHLATDLPRTCALWRAGDIDGFAAGKVVEAANRLTRPGNVAVLDAEAAERAATHTVAQLGRWLHRRVARLEPDAAERRHRRALADRAVSPRMEPDGMGSLWMLAGAADITAIDHRLDTLAKDLGADDPRTMAQRRADLARDLLLGNLPNGPDSGAGVGVGVVVPIQSLLGVDNTPGELVDRSNTVPAAFVRQLAARPDTLFYRLLTDPRGHLLDVTQLGRFPSRLLGLAVDVRDGTCRWTTCTTSGSKCDHDHTIAHPDGPTTAANLGDECRRHHRAKTAGQLRLEQPEPGVFVWTTPTGHTYTVEPEPLPLGTWPTPTVADEHTPLADLIDLIDTDADPPLWETTAADTLEPETGHQLLLHHETTALTTGPAP